MWWPNVWCLLAEISEMCFVIVLGPGWPRSRYLEGVRSLPAFGSSTACDSIILQGSSCVDFGFPNSLFSFCCTGVDSSMYTKEQPWQSFLVCRPILFYVGWVYRYIHGHICTCVQKLENHSGYFPLLLSTSFFETRSSQNLELADSAAAYKPQESPYLCLLEL